MEEKQQHENAVKTLTSMEKATSQKHKPSLAEKTMNAKQLHQLCRNPSFVKSFKNLEESLVTTYPQTRQSNAQARNPKQRKLRRQEFINTHLVDHGFPKCNIF
jgi:hypothetical protein